MLFKALIATARQVWESFRFALQSVAINKLRTGLSLLGITIGIFTIISIFTVISSLERGIREGIERIGRNAIYITRAPWVEEENEEGNREYQWWKYMNYPKPSYREYLQLSEEMPQAEAVVYFLDVRRPVEADGVYLPNVSTEAVTQDYNLIRDIPIASGRYFTPYESAHGAKVAIIGRRLADQLFGEGTDPVGLSFKIAKSKAEVIGVMEVEGQSMMQYGLDDMVIIPYLFGSTLANSRWVEGVIVVKGNPDADIETLKLETAAALRSIRRLPPSAENNFSLNEEGTFAQLLAEVISTINLAGWVIGLFSILVGGFGIANIMFVSVRERTSQIGIEKALGAKPYFILLQFTFEAVLLAIAGGAVGLLLIWAGAAAISTVAPFVITLTFGNIVLGLLISSAVGMVAGIFPAWSAARMEPVKAIYKT